MVRAAISSLAVKWTSENQIDYIGPLGVQNLLVFCTTALKACKLDVDLIT